MTNQKKQPPLAVAGAIGLIGLWCAWGVVSYVILCLQHGFTPPHPVTIIKAVLAVVSLRHAIGQWRAQGTDAPPPPHRSSPPGYRQGADPKASAPASEPAGMTLEGGGTVMSIRDLDMARRFPQEMPEHSLEADPAPGCPDGHGTMRPVLITTGTTFGDPATWEAYPLAIDGFRCETCGTMTFPVSLSAERITELTDRGVGHAQRGEFEEAEIALRRAIASWPGYSPPRVNLGALYLDRIRSEQQKGARPALIEQLVNECEQQLRRAIKNEPPAPLQAYFMLGRLLAKRDRLAEARPLLERVLSDPSTPDALRAESRRLLESN